MNLRERTQQHLAIIEQHGLWRKLKSPSAEMIDLSSNDYLGLANDDRLKSAMIAEIERTGCGSTGSRLLRGERAIFTRAENCFAEFKKTERALFFGSGYGANIGVLTAFLEPGDVVFSDEFNHASLIDGIRLSKAKRIIFPHNDEQALGKLIKENPCQGQRFLVVESLFSMDGDIAPLNEYGGLCREYNVALIIDEAHAVGVFGEQGSGLIEEYGIEQDVFLSINTAGKALGVSGAFAAGAAWAIELLIQRSRPFIFSTAPTPAVCAALIEAIEIVKQEPNRRAKLLELSRFLRESLCENEIVVSMQNSQIVPIVIGASERAVMIANELQANGFDVRAVRPPTVPENTARLRISLNSDLNEHLLLDFVRSLKSALLSN
ncbi:MAG: 8-amino-7-oxononanoate synthase [Pyrinomonadaceae bacterium]